MGNQTEAPKAPKFVCVHIEQKNGERYDVRLPFALMRTGMRFNALFPKASPETLEAAGLKLAKLQDMSEPELVEALRAGTISVTTSKGERVSLSCE
jgi:hypothetical protein